MSDSERPHGLQPTRLLLPWDFPGKSIGVGLPLPAEMLVPSLGPEDPLEEEMATHSRILAWRIPETEEPGGLQSTGHRESDTAERPSSSRRPSQTALTHSPTQGGPGEAST